MPFYVSDYLADTSHLSTVEHGAYMLLIMHYWRNAGLPDDEQKLARICRMTTRQWDAARDTIAEFFGEGWTHSRIDKEIARAADKSERRATSGQRGGIAKSLKTKESGLANATILPEQKPSNALASSSQPQPQPQLEREEDLVVLTNNIVGFEPKSKNRKPKNQKRNYSPAFEILWETFPFQRNASKAKAFEAYEGLSDEDKELALDGALVHLEFWRKRRERYPDYDGPHLSTWLNERRFETALEARQQ